VSEAHILADVDMARGERFELGGGEAVVLSLAKPGRDGPNEDAAAVISLGEQAGVAVVSDGAGGHPSGRSRCVRSATPWWRSEEI
jgi:hypothetical protein